MDQQAACQPSGNGSKGQVPALSFATSGMMLMALRPLDRLSIALEERHVTGARPRSREPCSEGSVLKCVGSMEGIKSSPRTGSADERRTSSSDHAHDDQNSDLDQWKRTRLEASRCCGDEKQIN